MATVCRALADEVNKDAAPQDKVTPRALGERVRTREGKDLIISKRDNDQDRPIEREEQPEMKPAELPKKQPQLHIVENGIVYEGGSQNATPLTGPTYVWLIHPKGGI